jgi:outer membrane receptor protein involved in Fe transport
MLSVWYSPFKRTAVNLDFNVFDRMYASFNTDSRNDETDRAQAYKVPAWCTLDLTLGHRFIFKKSFGMQLSGSLTNILNTAYFTYASDGWSSDHERNTALFYHGPGRGFVARVGLFL